METHEKLDKLLEITKGTSNEVLDLSKRMTVVETKMDYLVPESTMYREMHDLEDKLGGQLRSHSKNPRAHEQNTTKIKTEIKKELEDKIEKKVGFLSRLSNKQIAAIVGAVITLIGALTAYLS